MDEDAKIADEGRVLDSVGTGGGCTGLDGGYGGSDEVMGTRGSESDELSFIRITFKTVPT